MDMYFCACGSRAAGICLGTALCQRCWEDEDDAVESVERREAERLGYRYGWKEDQPKRQEKS
jgi:hypothetical protein